VGVEAGVAGRESEGGVDAGRSDVSRDFGDVGRSVVSRDFDDAALPESVPDSAAGSLRNGRRRGSREGGSTGGCLSSNPSGLFIRAA